MILERIAELCRAEGEKSQKRQIKAQYEHLLTRAWVLHTLHVLLMLLNAFFG